ncbi:MAG: hypothetical protein QW767_06130 [Thermoprotei archaeon]
MAYRFDIGRFVMIVIAVLFMSVLFLYTGLGGLGTARPTFSPASTFPFLVLVSIAVGLALSVVRVNPSKDDIEITTETRCPSCGFVAQRKFVNGDYITKQDQPCPKDATPMVIHKIYVVEPAIKK